MPRPTHLILAAVSVVSLACAADTSSDPALVGQRETLANGVVRVRYAPPPPDAIHLAVPDLTLGTVEGDLNFAFGDVRGVDAGLDGTVYVLDYLASEIRAFDRTGNFLRAVASRGQGPGELSEANGMILVGDSILWVQDHSKWMMIGLSPEGEELARVPMHVRSYGYIWSGTVDNAGRIWKPESHSDSERVYPPREGLTEGSARLFLKSFDPVTEVTDSVYLGDGSYRTFISQSGRGWSYRSIPFDPQIITRVDPDGGFWQVANDTYRIARLDERGDTTLVVEVDLDPIPVEQRDRSSYVDEAVERSPDDRRAAEEVASLMPETKPIIQDLVVDDVGRLWVQRAVGEDADPLYDLFSRDGRYGGTVRMGFRPDEYRRIRIRHGFIYAVELNELDVPFIIRAPVPEAMRRSPSRN